MHRQLEGKVALVTGASRGLGQAIAIALGQQGAEIIGTATTPDGAKAITEKYQNQQILGEGKVLDVGQTTSIKRLLDEIKPPDILVNNAGITRDNLLLRMKEDEWENVINTNLTAIYHLSKTCLRHMLKMRWGRIINISSAAGLMGNAGQTNYAAAKAGMLGFTRALALEVASRNITVNAVAPGLIETDMAKALTVEQQQILLTRVPCGRLGLPEEVAAAVVFLASVSAGYITGETLQVNGGMYMR